MSSYRPVDSKREEFRKYLEKTGALDVLTKVMVMLYEEPDKPADALEYIRKHLGDNRAEETELATLKADMEALLQKVQTLEEENKALKEKLNINEPEEMVVTEGAEEPVPVETAADSTSGNVVTEEVAEPGEPGE